MRKALTPAFAPGILRSQEAVVQGYIDTFINELGKKSNHAIDMNEYLIFLALDIIGVSHIRVKGVIYSFQ